jgi:hypothetical protein
LLCVCVVEMYSSCAVDSGYEIYQPGVNGGNVSHVIGMHFLY